MQATRPPPMIIHKEYTGKQAPLPDNGDELELPSLFSDEQIDVIAQALLICAPICATSGKLQSTRRLLSCAVKRICMKR